MTPAVDQLTRAGIEFSTMQYEHDPSADSYGDEAAQQLGLDPAEVFKTLVAQLDGALLCVAIVPTSSRLDLKALARVAGAKRAAMAEPAAAQRSTGYVLGGVSPFGQRQSLATFVDETAEMFDRVNVSGGRRGLELRLRPEDLIGLLGAVVAPIGLD